MDFLTLAGGGLTVALDCRSTIELLPGDGSEWFTANVAPEVLQYAPFLYVEGHLGVPQKLAYKLYLDSVSTFRDCRACLRTRSQAPLSSSNTPSQYLTDSLVKDTLVSCAVLLLVNPAHQSALNARKRLVQLGAFEATHELRFLSALLTLRGGAKQSILWHHRRWLLRRLHSTPSFCDHAADESSRDLKSPAGGGVDSLWGLSMDVEAFRTEFTASSQACEIYPRNYHAWTHRYLCAEALVELCTHPATSETRRTALMYVCREETRRMREWIDRHISDYSAMQYACYLESRRNSLHGAVSTQVLSHRDCQAGVDEPLSSHAWLLVKAYPAHESLWLYLRDALTASSRDDTVLVGLGSIASKTILADAQAFAERLLSDESAEATATVSPGDHPLVRNHAVRFLAWALWTEKRFPLDEQSVLRVARLAEGAEDPLTRPSILEEPRLQYKQ
ncbi:hypothetical protein BD414DRAFT_468584 [Trametes punicea]|nr:hypothetical protein BD414DRAFT_468584 [Trametes punicea]